MDTDRRRAFMALTAAGLIWGLTVPLSKLALDWLDPLWLSVLRFSLAAPLLALLARSELRRAVRGSVIVWGIVLYGAVMGVQNLGLDRTSVSHGALILGAVPALVALVAVVLGRGRAGARAWGGFSLALVGVGLVSGAGGQTSLLGDAFVLASAMLTALVIVAQADVLRGRDPVAVTAVQMAAGALVSLPLALSLEGLPGPPPAAAPVWGFAVLVVVGSLLPFTLYAYGQTRVVPEVAGAFINLEPLVGAVLGALAFHDPWGPAQAGGAIAIAVGIVLSARSERTPPRGASVRGRPLRRREPSAAGARPAAVHEGRRRAPARPPSGERSRRPPVSAGGS